MSILAFPNPIYQPAMRIITAITNAPMAQVTTSFDHLYLTGSIVRLDIPLGFGMQLANQQFGEILSIPTPTTFTMSLDTTLFDAFVLPVGWPATSASAVGFPVSAQAAMVVPFAEDNKTLKSAVQNTLPHLAT
jgi:hypothetical protein